MKKANKAQKFVTNHFNEGINGGLEIEEAVLKTYNAASHRFPGRIPPEYTRALEQLCCDHGL